MSEKNEKKRKFDTKINRINTRFEYNTKQWNKKRGINICTVAGRMVR